MATTLASGVRWTSSNPAILLDFSYTSSRSGSDMAYTVTVSCRALTGDSYYGYPINLEIRLDGGSPTTQQLKAASPSQWTSALSYTTPSLTVKGKTSGSTTLSVRVYAGSGSSRNVTYTYSLPVIPAASDFTITKGALGSVTEVEIIPASAAYSHQMSYSVGSGAAQTTAKAAAGVKTITFTIPSTAAGASGTTASVSCTLHTFSGSTEIGTVTHSYTYYLANSVIPTVASVTAAVADKGCEGLAVNGYTTFKFTVSAAAGDSVSKVSSYRLSVGGQSYTSATNTVITGAIRYTGAFTGGSASVPYTVTVTDSRGRTSGGKSGSVMVYEYAPPAITVGSANLTRTAAGTKTPDVNGTSTVISATAACSSVNGKNTVALTYATRKQEGGSAWSAEKALTAGTETILSGLDSGSAWEIRITAKDKATSTARVLVLPAARFQLVLGKDRCGILTRPDGTGTWIGGDLHVLGRVVVEGKKMSVSASDTIKYSLSSYSQTLYRVTGSQNMSASELKALGEITVNGKKCTLGTVGGLDEWAVCARWSGTCGSYTVMVIWDAGFYTIMPFGYDIWKDGNAETTGIFVNSSTASVTIGGIETVAADMQTVVGRFAGSGADGSLPDAETDGVDGVLFAVGAGTSDTARSTGFRVTAGSRISFGSAAASGADYAEYFEWADANAGGCDRRGRIVTLEGEKIRLANGGDNWILGVISACPGAAGDACEDTWQGKYVKDIYGAPVVETVEIPETFRREGEGIVTVPAHSERHLVISPGYDPYKAYIPRRNRGEWACVGLVGKLTVLDDGSCVPGGFCAAGEDGAGTASGVPTRLRVMSRLDGTHIRVCLI